ncbi:hypothetical protein MBANPS3_003780 [Mucor bainieri]
MNTTLEQDSIVHDKNTPKLQWLFLLIPALGAFVAYSLIRVHSKRKKAQQTLLDQESQQHSPLHHPITAPSPSHPSSFIWQRHDAPPPAYEEPSSSTLPKYDDLTEPSQTH